MKFIDGQQMRVVTRCLHTMATVTISVSLDPEIAGQLKARLRALGMGQSEYIAHLIRNDLLTTGSSFKIVVDAPGKDDAKKKR
jgi:hypothetical protein